MLKHGLFNQILKVQKHCLRMPKSSAVTSSRHCRMSQTQISEMKHTVITSLEQNLSVLVNSHGWSLWDGLILRVSDVMLRFLCLHLFINFKNILIKCRHLPDSFTFHSFIYLPEYRSYDENFFNF